jgi:hypothetical protein
MLPALTSRTTIALIAIFLLALTLRLAWIANTDTTAPPLSDPQYHHATAQNLARGRGYTVAVDEHGFAAGPESETTAFWPPGYAFALAPLYAIAGDEERVAKAFNAIAGALTVVPVYFIAASLFSGRPGRRTAAHRGAQPANHAAGSPNPGTDDLRLSAPGSGGRGVSVAGLPAAALFAFMPPLIYWTPVLFSDTLLALGVASTFAVALPASQRDPGGHTRGRLSYMAQCALAGALLAATAMVKSQALVLALPVALLLVPHFAPRAAVQALVPAAIAGAAVILPWTVRNQVAMGEPYLVNDNLCYNLRASHAPYATGGSVPPQDLWDEQPGISFRERELFFDDIGCGRAWEYAREHPLRELELASKRVGWLLRSDAADAIEWSRSLGRTPLHRGGARAFVLIGDLYWYPFLALAAASALVVARTRPQAALWLALLAWAALHTVFHGEPRYHVAMTPLLAALAAASVVSAAGDVRALRRS